MKDHKSAYALVVRCGCAGGGKGALVQTDVCGTISTSVSTTYIFHHSRPSGGDDGVQHGVYADESSLFERSMRDDNTTLPQVRSGNFSGGK